MSPSKIFSSEARRWTAFRRIVFLTLALGGAAPGIAEIKPGDKFPALDPAQLVGGAIPSPAGKIVLVDFWASWCAPCKESFPFYAGLHSDLSRQGLLIVAVSVDQNAAAFGSFLKKMAPPFPTLRDKDQQLVRDVKVPAMPTCYLIDRTGHVRWIHQGFHGTETERSIRREIEALLQEPNSSS